MISHIGIRSRDFLKDRFGSGRAACANCDLKRPAVCTRMGTGRRADERLGPCSSVALSATKLRGRVLLDLAVLPGGAGSCRAPHRDCSWTGAQSQLDFDGSGGVNAQGAHIPKTPLRRSPLSLLRDLSLGTVQRIGRMKLPRVLGLLLCWLGFHDFHIIDATFGFGGTGNVERIECRRCGLMTTRQM